MQQKSVTTIFFAAILALTILAPNLIRTASTQGNATNSLEVSASTSPARIHQGDNTTIAIKISNATPGKTYTLEINVSDPAGTSSAVDVTVLANSEGLGSTTTQYWGAFIGANTTNLGTYSVTVTNVTTNEILASTEFSVEVWLCQLLARDLANEPVFNLAINVYNKTSVPTRFLNLSRLTNETGWASFMLATGNYTFEAFWKQAKVGSLPLTKIENDTVLEEESWVQLSNLKVTVKDEATNGPLPFVQLKLEYNYTTESNENLTDTRYFETDFTGTVKVRNLFMNNSYVVEATRYGVRDLSLPKIQNETAPLPWNNVTIVFPVYTAFVQVMDSRNNAVEAVRVEAHEWGSGLTQSKTTDSNGDITFSLTFGRYRVRTYNGAILLNETLIDLTQNQSSLLIYLHIYNIDFTVKVVDYFNQPIRQAMVKIERRIDGYEQTVPSGFTKSDGRITFSSVLGGDSRISVYVSGQLSETRDLYLTDSEEVAFTLNRYAVVLGYVAETRQLVTAIFIVGLFTTPILALTYKRLRKMSVKNK